MVGSQFRDGAGMVVSAEPVWLGADESGRNFVTLKLKFHKIYLSAVFKKLPASVRDSLCCWLPNLFTEICAHPTATERSKDKKRSLGRALQRLLSVNPFFSQRGLTF